MHLQIIRRLSTVNATRVAASSKSALFDEEKRRQLALVGRVEKIEVKVKDVKPEGEAILLMNKGVSTPFNCAQHLHEIYCQRSVVAKVGINDKYTYWDMHRPLPESCEITFHHFKEENPFEINKAFWRSASFLLGMVIQKAFKDEIPILLHSWPKPNLNSGSFVYDVDLPTLECWSPSENELRTLSAVYWKVREMKAKFERLDVSWEFAKELFSDNIHKINQLENMQKSEYQKPTVSVYRVDDHLDLSVGPMIPDTSFLGRITVTAVHRITHGGKQLYRFQGVALPSQLRLHFSPYRILTERAKQLNQAPFPQ